MRNKIAAYLSSTCLSTGSRLQSCRGWSAVAGEQTSLKGSKTISVDWEALFALQTSEVLRALGKDLTDLQFRDFLTPPPT